MKPTLPPFRNLPTKALCLLAALVLCNGQQAYGQRFINFLKQALSDSLAQDTIGQRPKKFDTRYLRDYSAYIFPTVYLASFTQGVTFNTNGQPFRTVDYQPSQPVRIGGSLFYKWLGLAFSLPLAMDPDQERRLGKTKSLDFQFNFYFRRWGLDAYYQDYRNFYINNSGGIFPNYNTDVQVQRTDIKTFNMGANAFYVFNHKKFSYQAAFNQAERQLKSAGSFIMMGSFTRFQINADSAMVPLLNPATSNRDLFITRGLFAASGISVGYAHTFVIKKKAFFSLTLLPGIALGYMDFTNAFGEKLTSVRGHFRFNTRAALGFNGDRYYYGITFFSDINNIYFNEAASLNFTTANAFLFFGRRLSAEMILLKRMLHSRKARTLQGKWEQ
jgi:hypothetical protein